MFLGVAIENRALRFARTRERYLVGGARTAQHPGDDSVLALVDGCRRRLAAHRPVHGLDGGLTREGWRVGLPGRYLALARLARRGGGVQRLANGLVRRRDVETQQGAQSRGHTGSEVRDVVDPVFVQRDGARQVDLDLVTGGDSADELVTTQVALLGDVL